jgi:hypothetical protein
MAAGGAGGNHPTRPNAWRAGVQDRAVLAYLALK